MQTKCHWVIENFTEAEDMFLMIQAVKDAEQPLTIIGRKNGFEYKHIQFDNECVLFHGSIQMAKLVNDHLKNRGCSPVIWDDNINFECTAYYPKFKHLLFNANYEFLTVESLKGNKWDVYQTYAKEAMIFVRPSGGEKSFAGQLIDLQDFDRFFSNNIVCNANDSDMVVVSTPKNVIGEWRYIVTSEKKIIAKSCYKYQGKITSIPSAPVGATELIEKVLDVGYYPAKMFAADVCMDNDGNFWLMEFNSFNSCGLYSCNKRAIVDEATRLAIDAFNTKT